MILKPLSEIASAIAPSVANHLWQTTLFATAAALLAFLFRKNYARTRYWLWFAASLKFLVPFSLLAALGSHLPWSRVSTGTQAELYFAVEQLSEPFTRPAMLELPRTPLTPASPSMPQLLPPLLAGVWLCGFLVAFVMWYIRWRQISLLAREAKPLERGREVEMLRRLEHIAEIRKPIEIRLSRASLEPGIFGLTRPVLIWPAGISDRLNNAQLEAVLAHELGHVRRRDNLTAATHMLVEAIFWFHPLVWWLGARLVEERERACDEDVLAFGSERRVYAESILKTCEFCLESPLACMSGVTGADLKERIVHIMTEGLVPRLDLRRKMLLGAAGLAAVVIPVVSGLPHAAQTRIAAQVATPTVSALGYDVASIKPNKSGDNRTMMMFTPDGLTATGGSLMMLIMSAYGVNPHQISGAPVWLTSERYDIEAKMDPATAEELRKLSEDQRRAATQHMLQMLLADRFKLRVHQETKDLPIYALVVAKNGPKLQEAKPGDTYPNGMKGPDGRSGAGLMLGGKEGLTAQGIPIANLVRHLSLQLGRTVIDKTGLTGEYDFTLKWTPDGIQGAMFRGPESGQPSPTSAAFPDSSGPSLFTALEEQLGLKLESQKGPVEIVVLDHVERPSEN
jgi:bla regulator protein blaR1